MDLERWYVKRKKEEKKYRTIRNQQIQMPLRQQANSVFDTLAPVFGQFRHGFLLSSELDTEVLLKYSNIKWQNTGFENINNFVLKRNGKPTAFLTRMAFLNEIIKTRTGEIIYVDSTNAIKNAIGVIEGITGRTIYSVPGAAVGFDFVIHSGSHSKDDVTLTSIYKWYLNSVSCQLSELIDDINYLTIFLPMHISEHKKDEGFYNFRTVNDLKAAIIEVHKKRIETLDKIKQARLLITIGTKSIIKPNTPSFIKQKSKYALQKFIKRAYRTFTKGDLSVKSYYNYLEEQPENINAANRECPKGVTTSQNKLYYYLLKCLQCNINIHSTTLDILRLEGYCSNEELISALNNLLNFDIEMKLQLSYSQMILHHIMLIMDNYLSLSKEDSELYFSIIDYYLQSLK